MFNIIWQEERVQEKQKKGLIIKNLNKRDMRDCNNGKGVTLVSVMRKVFGRIQKNRLNKEVS